MNGSQAVAALPAPAGAVARPAAPAGRLGERLVLLYLVLEYFRPQYYLPFLAAVRPGLIAFGLGTLFLLFGRRHRVPAPGWLVLLFVGLLFKTVPFAQSMPKALIATSTLFTMSIAGPLVMMVALDGVEKLRRAAWVYAALGVILALQGIRRQGRGVAGFFTDENDLGMELCTVLPIAWFHAASATRRSQKLLAWGAFVLCTLGVLVSFSRGAFLGLVVVLGYVLLHSRVKVAAAAALVAAALVVIPFVPAGYFGEIETIETAANRGDTGEVRLYMWGVAWKVFTAHPLMGVGAVNYPLNAPFYEDPERAAEGRHLWGVPCHSVYFTLLAESGLPGALVWGLVVALAFRATRRVSRATKPLAKGPAAAADPERAARAYRLLCTARGLEGALLGFLVTGAFLTVNYYPNMWTLVALMAAAPLAARTDGLLPAPPRGARR